MDKLNSPKVLLLAYSFPPSLKVSAIRAGNIARYLSIKGWQITVVTPNPSLFTDVDDNDRSIARLFKSNISVAYTDHNRRFLSSGDLKWPRSGIGYYLGGMARIFARKFNIDVTDGWYNSAFLTCSKLFNDEHFDIILATGGPWNTFKLAYNLYSRFKCPYILDYRDLWTAGNPHNNTYDSPKYRRIEEKYISAASAILTVSPSCARLLEEAFNARNGVRLVTNGYDSDIISSVDPVLYDEFSIVYTGYLIPPKRVIDPILCALKKLAVEHPEFRWKFHYYGPHNEIVRLGAEKMGVLDKVELHGFVSRKEALSAQKGADLGTVITSVEDHCDLGTKGIITGKIFEVVGLRTPFIVIAPPGSDIEDIVAVTGGGRIFPGNDIEGIAGYILEIAEGKLPQWHNPDFYSWSHIISDVDMFLQNLLK